MGSFFAFLSLMLSSNAALGSRRGWKDRYHGDDDGTGLLRFDIFRTDFFVDSSLGYWGCVGHCGGFDDSEVSSLLRVRDNV